MFFLARDREKTIICKKKWVALHAIDPQKQKVCF